jgi:hypothetical protein
MQPLLYVKPYEVEQRLAALGTNSTVFQDAARAGKLARSTANPFHPIVYAGFMLYANTLAALGELMTSSKDDWCREDPAGHPLVVSHRRKLALTVATADSNTGNGDGNRPPNTRPAKGVRTQEAVEENHNLLFPDMYDGMKTRHDLLGFEFWWLLMHIDLRENKLRLEVSKGVQLNRERAIAGWSERVMLASQPLDEGSIPLIGDPNGDGPEHEYFDVDVRKLG